MIDKHNLDIFSPWLQLGHPEGVPVRDLALEIRSGRHSEPLLPF